ncbi:hypothetical protein [Pseudoalteromonas xiamenensis]
MERKLTINALFGDRINNKIAKLFTYYFDQPFSITNGELFPAEQLALFCVVSKKNTVITRKVYQSISRSEVRAIVNLQKKSASKLTHFDIIAKLEDEFEVVKTEFLIDNKYQRQFGLFIAEDALIAESYPDCSLSIETPAGELFVSGESGKSAYRGGLLRTVEQFMHSIGISSKNNINVNKEEFANFLNSSINLMSLNRLFKKVHSYLNTNRLAKMIHLCLWGPLIGYTLGALFVCLSAYLTLENIEKQLSEKSVTATDILKQKAALDAINELSIKMNELLHQNKAIYQHWDLLAIALEQGAIMNFFRYDNGIMKIDGAIENANELIAKFNKNPMVESAVFDGAVRKNNNLDNFSIHITFKENELPK